MKSFRKVQKSVIQVAILALMCVGQIAFAQDSGLTKRVDLYLKDAELLTATQMLTKQTGLQFVISPTADEFKKINLSLADVTAEQAISYICEAAGAYATKDENGVFIIRHGSKVAAEPKNGGVANTTPTKVKKPLKIAIMGCVVNGPGEASDADIGIAGGKDEALLFIRGEKVRMLKGDIVGQLLDEIHKM